MSQERGTEPVPRRPRETAPRVPVLAGHTAGFPARHHVVCRSCGRTEDVDCLVGPAACLSPADASGYMVDDAEVVFWGRCPECVRLAMS